MAGAAGLAPQAIVLALGAGALGGPDALRLLRQFAGRSAAVDLATCVVVISLGTATLLGTMLLAHFVRKARPGASAPAMDLFAQVTATVSVGAAFLVTACLLVVPGGAVHLPIDFVVKKPVVVTVVAICTAAAATAAATGSLPCAVPLLGFLRGAGGAGGSAPVTPATTIKIAFLVAVSLVTACLLVVLGGGLGGAVSLPIDFVVRNPFVVTVLVVCGAFAFAATGSLPCAVPLLHFLRGAGSAGGPAPTTPATTIKIVFVVAVSLVASFVAFASGGFHWRRSMVTMPIGVAIAVVTAAGTTLLVLVRWSRRARNTAGVGGGAAARTS